MQDEKREKREEKERKKRGKEAQNQEKIVIKKRRKKAWNRGGGLATIVFGSSALPV